MGIRFPFPLLPHVEKVKSEEVIVKRWKALPVGEGGPLGPGEGPLFFFIYSPFFILWQDYKHPTAVHRKNRE